MMAKLAALIDCCRETKKSQFKMKESRFKKTEIRKKEIRKKEIIQNEFQTIQKKKRKIGLDKIQIGDARNKRTTDRKWLTNNNRYLESHMQGLRSESLWTGCLCGASWTSESTSVYLSSTVQTGG